MIIDRKLFIASNEKDLSDIIKHLDGKNINDIDLLTFINIDYYEINLKKIFNYIYDLSNQSIEIQVEILLKKVLDLSYYHKNKEKIEYTEIYYGLKKCNLSLRKQTEKDYFGDNRHYGHFNVFRNFCDYNNTSYILIEHGLHFGGYVPNYEISNNSPAIITFGDYSYKYIREKTSKPILKVGPYIHYAKNLYTDEFINYIKAILGKTLLVFPMHSIDKVYYEYNIEEFMMHIEGLKRKYNFETIIICMYWKDIELGINKYYEDKGYKVVSAGHRNNNISFLNRLKTIISISDYTISNSLGTHTGYCVYLNKPHQIFNQNIIIKGKDENSLKIEFDKRGNNFEDLYNEEKRLFYNVFNEFNLNITKEQYEICNKYWGFDCIRTQEEMKDIMQFYNTLFIEANSNIQSKINIKDINKMYLDYINLKLKENLKYKEIILNSIK